MIPKQLLATVILNELADINWIDVWQQSLGIGGSLGIAQIQVDTALKNKLVTYPSDYTAIHKAAAKRQNRCINYSRNGVCSGTSAYANEIERELVRKRLAMPKYAIEAAAREIRRLLDSMTTNLANPWQAKFSFSLTSYSLIKKPADLYLYISGANQKAKEQNLANLVIAAYNSPQIIIAKKATSITPGNPTFIYKNGTIHGSNGSWIAGELFDMKLYH